MKILLLAALTLAFPALAQNAPPAASKPVSAIETRDGQLSVHLEKTRLPNGFEVIFVEDHRLPLVAFNLWIHAGPRNEGPGQTGFAHLFEHLMFAGSKHLPRGVADRVIDAVGGTDSNGSTDFDRTNYYFTLPSNQLELGLWLQSDQLGYMIDEIDPVALANQQDVVRNERRQNWDERPYGVADEAMFHALFPAEHPYRAAIIGSHADIQGIQLKDVYAFAKRYYRPNNATLVLAGDFDPKVARRLVEKYYGPLKAGEPVPPVKVQQPVLHGETHLDVSDRVELSRLAIGWQTPAFYAEGDAALDVTANILGGGRASRLYQLLVRDKQLAQSVNVYQQSLSLGSVFFIEVVARPGHTPAELQPLVDAELKRLATTPPSQAELDRARASIRANALAAMERVGGLADLVNGYNQLAGDPDFLAKDIARYTALTPESVRAAAARWLPVDARVVEYTVPGEKHLAPDVPTPPPPTAAAAAKAERVHVNADEKWRSEQPRAGAAPAVRLPAAERFQLANGLTVIHVERPGLPLVSASLVVRAGQDANPSNVPGLAGFTAAMLREGTATRSSTQIAEQLADLGLSFGADAGKESASLSLSGLKASFAGGLALVADMVQHPAFAPEEIERRRAARLAALAEQRVQPPAVAQIVAARMLYGPNSPLGTNPLGDEAALKLIDASVLRQFWSQRYRPDQAALIVTGDIDAAELRALAEAQFGAWARPATPPLASGAWQQPNPARLVFVNKPGAAQTAISVVAPGPKAGDPQASSFDVMNDALGGLFTSRINQQLREVKGYTYSVVSGFARNRNTGAFVVQGEVRSDVTGAALKDLFEQLNGMVAEPMEREEFERARNAELLSLPGSFSTNADVAQAYAGNWVLGLPDAYLVDLPRRVEGVSAISAFQAALRGVRPDAMIVIAVGDRAQVLPQLQAFGRVPLIEVDDAGALLAAPAAEVAASPAR